MDRGHGVVGARGCQTTLHLGICWFIPSLHFPLHIYVKQEKVSNYKNREKIKKDFEEIIKKT